MSDRIKGLLIHLDHDYKDLDASDLVRIFQMIKGVTKVEPIPANLEDHLNRSRAKHELKEKIIDLLYDGD